GRCSACPDATNAGTARDGELGQRLAARTESDLMTLADQFLREIRHHPFRSSVIFRRNTLKKRCDLSASHRELPPLLPSFFDRIRSRQIHKQANQGVPVDFPQPSRTTSLGFLSSRNPRKTVARNFPSRVHSP